MIFYNKNYGLLQISLGHGDVAIWFLPGSQDDAAPVAIIDFARIEVAHKIGAPVQREDVKEAVVWITASEDKSLATLAKAIKRGRIWLAKKKMIAGLVKDNLS